jgi:hypothetical protein
MFKILSFTLDCLELPWISSQQARLASIRSDSFELAGFASLPGFPSAICQRTAALNALAATQTPYYHDLTVLQSFYLKRSDFFVSLPFVQRLVLLDWPQAQGRFTEGFLRQANKGNKEICLGRNFDPAIICP